MTITEQRHEQVVSLIAMGYTTEEIAGELFLGRETIKTYRNELLVKYGAKNSAHLVKLWLEEKWQNK